MSFVVRATLLLLATVPLFVVTEFHPPIWQVFLAAAVGSGLGQLALRLTRGRPPIVSILIAAGAMAIATGSAVLLQKPATPPVSGRGLIVIANQQTPTLTMDDATALAELAQVAAIAPYQRVTATVLSESANWSTNVAGTSPSYLDVRGWRMARGNFFSADDEGSAAKVVVLGAITAKQLLGEVDPVGQSVRLRNVPFTVVGVLASSNTDDDDVALLPLATFNNKVSLSLGRVFSGRFLIRPRAGGSAEAIRALLRDRHRLSPSTDDDFVLREL